MAAYIAQRADDGLSPASLRMDRTAIRYHHNRSRTRESGRYNEGVRRVLRGLTRQAACEGRTPRQDARAELAAKGAVAQFLGEGSGGRRTWRHAASDTLQASGQGRHPDTRREGGREIRRRDVLQEADPELPSRDPAGGLSSWRWSAPFVLLGAARGLVALARPMRMPAPDSDEDSVPVLIACHDLDSTRYPHLLLFIGVVHARLPATPEGLPAG